MVNRRLVYSSLSVFESKKKRYPSREVVACMYVTNGEFFYFSKNARRWRNVKADGSIWIMDLWGDPPFMKRVR